MLFKDQYFFLSTFYPCVITLNIEGKECTFTNVEAAYQAQKNPAIADRFKQVKGLEAKRMEDTLIIMVDDWDNYKLIAMAKALNAKFKHLGLFSMLKGIQGDIINDNYWHDTYWGVYKGDGLNILGKMLMHIRDHNNDLESLISYVKTDLNQSN